MASAISIDFTAPFDVQAAQARAQGVVLPEYYYGLLPAEKRKYAQTVSSLAGLDQIQAVVDKLAEFQAEGKTLHEFKKWAKTQEWTLPKGRLETIYRNSVQTAYQAGHWRDFEENADERPYLIYDAINDSRVRPGHLALDNTIKPVNDPFWQTHSPPLGHRCRCSLRSLSQREAMRLGGVTQNVPAEAKADEGWGSKPTEWGDVLERLKAQKMAKVHPSVAQAAQNVATATQQPQQATPMPKTVNDFINAGRAITSGLPDGYIDPISCHSELLNLLQREVGISNPCKVSSKGAGAKLVEQASQLYPDSWTNAADVFGPLYARIDTSAKARGWQWTETANTVVNLPSFGIVNNVTPGTGWIVTSARLETAVHEYAHRLQSALPDLDALFQDLHKTRTAGEPLEKLNAITSIKYKNNELARKDKYVNPYQGKEYAYAPNAPALEVMTMAFQNVLGLNHSNQSRLDFQTLYTQDRDMFDFAVGLLRYWKP